MAPTAGSTKTATVTITQTITATVTSTETINGSATAWEFMMITSDIPEMAEQMNIFGSQGFDCTCMTYNSNHNESGAGKYTCCMKKAI